MTFEQWLNEPEGHGYRFERLHEFVGAEKYPVVLRWLKAAYDEGFEAGIINRTLSVKPY